MENQVNYSIDEWGKIDISKPDPKKGKFLWKYINFHKLLDFLHSSELHFTRLDSFNDPFEGVKMSLLRERNDFKDRPNSPELYNSAIDLKQRNVLSVEKLVHDESYRNKVESGQANQFVNCWFHGDRESMAMWELYSSKDSVSIQIEADKLIESILNDSKSFVVSYGNRLHLLGDSVKYLKINPFDPALPLVKSKYAAMKKDESYRHEQEYRFLISALPLWISQSGIDFFRFKLDFKKLQFNVVCHPLMEDWKIKNIEKLVKTISPNFTVKPSSIELKK